MSRLAHRTVVVQMAMGSYRQGFLDYLSLKSASIDFLVGDQHFGTSLLTDVSSRLVHSTGKNSFLFGRRIGFQRVPLSNLIKYGQVVVELNPRNLTTWAILIGRRLLGRPTHGWGHVESRSKTTGLSAAARRSMQFSCTSLIVYTRSEADRARAIFPNKRVVVASNALYSATEMVPSSVEPAGNALVWIGRVVEDKKPLLAVEIMQEARRRNLNLKLYLVGEGPMLEEVRAAVTRNDLDGEISVCGKITETDALRNLFGSSIALLATGYVGLNVTQALGFGVPVVFPDDEPHAPEIEALDKGNSISFRSDNAASCVDTLEDLINGELPLKTRREISKETASSYSVEAMAQAFLMLEDDQ